MTADQDPFRYGRRIHITQNVTAQPTYDTKPLQQEDFLNPAEGDEFNHGDRHARDVARLGEILRYYYRYNPATMVVESAILRWPSPELAAPAPDICIITGLPGQGRRVTTLDVAVSGAQVRAVIEVTSPLFAALDLEEKVAIYRQAGVPEYWVIDTGLRPGQPDPDYRVHGWRLAGDDYTPVTPDEHGRYVSPACRIWLRLTHDDHGFEVGDIRTGQPITPGEAVDPRDAGARAEANMRAQSIADQLDL